jgi:hypothetical protein
VDGSRCPGASVQFGTPPFALQHPLDPSDFLHQHRDRYRFQNERFAFLCDVRGKPYDAVLRHKLSPFKLSPLSIIKNCRRQCRPQDFDRIPRERIPSRLLSIMQKSKARIKSPGRDHAGKSRGCDRHCEIMQGLQWRLGKPRRKLSWQLATLALRPSYVSRFERPPLRWRSKSLFKIRLEIFQKCDTWMKMCEASQKFDLGCGHVRKSAHNRGGNRPARQYPAAMPNHRFRPFAEVPVQRSL